MSQNQPGVKRAAILEYVRGCIEEGRPSPTIREIGHAVGVSSTSVINYHLNRLRRDGLLNRAPAISRGLSVPGMVPVAEGADVVVVIDGREVVAPFVRAA